MTRWRIFGPSQIVRGGGARGAVAEQWMLVATMAVTGFLVMTFAPQLTGLDIDDAWYMWFTWRFVKESSLSDPMFFSNGTQLFGVSWVAVLGSAYALGNWSLDAGHFVSTACIIGVASIWYRLGLRLGWSKHECAAVAALLVVMLPFVRAGLSARPEAFILLLASAAVLALETGHGLVAGLLVGLAIETHPLGIISLGYVLGWSWRQRAWPLPAGQRDRVITRKVILWLGIGLALGAAYYLVLHAGFIHRTLAEQTKRMQTMASWNTAVVAYFQAGDLRRRLWDGLLLLCAVGAYFGTTTWRREPFVMMGGVCVLAVLFALPRANPFYYVYFAPFVAFALALSVHGRVARLATVAVVAIIGWVGYAAVAIASSSYSPESLNRALQARLHGSGAPVVVSAMLWPALRCEANVVSISETGSLLAQNRPFYVVTDFNWDFRRTLPPDTMIERVILSPRAQFMFYRVRPHLSDPTPHHKPSFAYCR